MSNKKPQIMDMGREQLVENNYSKENLRKLCLSHGVKLRMEIAEESITSDMIKVCILVYYGWRIPSKLVSALEDLIIQLHLFTYFPDSFRSYWVNQLIDKPDYIGKFFAEIIKKYFARKNESKEYLEKYTSIRSLAFYYGYVFTLGGSAYDVLMDTVTSQQRIALFKYFKRNNGFKIKEFPTLLKGLNKDGTEKHPTDSLLKNIDKLQSGNNSRPEVGIINTSSNQNNGSFSQGMNDNDDDIDLQDINQTKKLMDKQNSKNNSNVIISPMVTPKKLKKMKTFVREEISKLYTENHNKLNEKMEILKGEIDTIVSQETKKQVDGIKEIRKMLNSITYRLDRDYQKSHEAPSTTNGHDSNIIFNKYDRMRNELNNDSRFDDIPFKFKKQNGQDPVELQRQLIDSFSGNTGKSSNNQNTSSDKNYDSNNNSSNNNSSQHESKYDISNSVLSRFKSNSMGGDDSPSSSDSDKDKKDKISTPERDFTVRRYKKRDYSNAVT